MRGLVLLGALLLAPAAAAQTDWTAVDRQLATLVERTAAPGAGLVVIHRGEVVHRKTVGELAPAQVVSIASASKWLTVVTLLALVDAGVVDLDAPVSRYLPEFTGDKAAITVRQCLSCTAGLPPRVPGATKRASTVTSTAAEIAAAPLKEPPGTALRYGGCGFQVAARVAEVVTGKRWHEVFAERVTRPLGMTHTVFGGFTFDMKRADLGADGRPKPGGNPWAGGSAVSTLNDYARLVRMLDAGGVWQGKRILSQARVDEMFRDHTVGLRVAYSPHPDHSIRYGLGTWIERKASDGTSVDVCDPGAFGWTPWIERDNRIAGLLAIKSRYPKVEPHLEALQREIRKALGAEHALAPRAAPPARLGPLAERMLKRQDTDGDGKISRAEYRGFGFRRLDANGDGYLDRSELAKVGQR